MSLTTQTVPGSYGVFSATQEEVLSATGETTSWIGLTGQLAVQITGDATAVKLQVERSTRRPTRNGQPNTAPAGDPIIGNPAAGIQTCAYMEPGIAWWRVRCVSIDGGAAVVVITGIGV